MIHKYSLIAEFEWDDENGEYTPPSISEVERDIQSGRDRLGLNQTFFEVEKGTLKEAFGINE